MNKKSLILGLGTLILVLIAFFKPFRFIDNLFYDLNFLLAAHDASDSVIVVGIDYSSIRELGSFPWPRSKMAFLVEKISSGSPKTIALDFLFPKRSEKEENDSLASVFSHTPNLVLPFRAGGITSDKADYKHTIPNDILNFRILRYSSQENLENIQFYSATEVDAADTIFTKYARYGGFLNVSTSNSSQKIREAIHIIKVGEEYFPSFGISAAASYYRLSPADLILDGNGSIQLKETTIPLTPYAATTFINFRNQKNPIREISAIEVIDGRIDPSIFKDKLVFVGVTDPLAGADFFTTPVQAQYPGVKIWATMALDILQKSWIKIGTPLLTILNWVFLLFMFPGLALLFPEKKRVLAVVTGVAATALSIAVGFYAFRFLNSYWESSSHVYAWFFSLIWLAMIKADPTLSGRPSINLEPDEAAGNQIIPPPTEEDLSSQLPKTDTSIFAAKMLDSSGENRERGLTLSNTIIAKKAEDIHPEPRTIVQSSAIIDKLKDIAEGKIIRTLGSGGMADVYLVWNPRLELYRAVKVIKPDQSETFQKRFETELRIFSKLDHPNIVHCYGVGEWHSLPYIEMEFVNGASTEEIIHKCKALSVEQAFAIGIQVAKALHYAHNQVITIYGKTYRGIIHRDLKPANIMITRSGKIKLTDFGIARPLDVSLHTIELGSVVGTLPYLAPEQLGEQELTCRTDVYALGATLYELIAGVRPFTQTEVPALITAKNSGTYKPLSSHLKVPEEVSGVIDKALSVDPLQRYSSAHALRLDMEKVLFSLSGQDGYKHLSQLVNRYWN